ncbi:MAG: glutathione-disulfide reductase [Oligoflexales bacterium]|nr:glutathione-disulfide reductase [Oligoflexales bacterium]
MTSSFDYLVIGGGSGGIASANRAAMHGAKVALFEGQRLGGTCVNVGCVPKKVMYNAANLNDQISIMQDYGLFTELQVFDFGLLKKNRDAYVQRLNSIYANTLRNNGVTVIPHNAHFVDKYTLEAGGELYTAKHILLAVGGTPRMPKIPGIVHCINSDGFFELEHLPKKVAIVGSGYIATEIAGILNALGSEVFLFLRKETVIANFDSSLRDHLLLEMIDAGINIIKRFQVTSISKHQNRMQLHGQDSKNIYSDFDQVIIAIGRDPNTQTLGLDLASVDVNDEGNIVIDEFQNTTAPGIYAVGDITGHKQLTPVAIKAGRILSERLFNGQTTLKMEYDIIPTVMFTHPPLGTIGLTEEEAVNNFGRNQIKIFTSTFSNMYYALSDQRPKTFMKLITTGREQRIVGLHAIGHGVDEMIQGFAVAMKMGATKADFDRTVAIHPTASEEFVTMR